MAEAELKIKQWGNNLGVRLPASIVRAVGLQDDQLVRLAVQGGSVVITPISSPPLSLEERLARFDPERHGGEAMATERIGAERW